jgi:hypothetical protein
MAEIDQKLVEKRTQKNNRLGFCGSWRSRMRVDHNVRNYERKKPKERKNMSEKKEKIEIEFHAPGCDEVHGMCNCDPKIIRMEEGGWSIENGELTCALCGEHCSGEINRKIVVDTAGDCWELLWAPNDDLFYFISQQDESNRIRCRHCLWSDEIILPEEVCNRTGWDLTTVYQLARRGEIPGALWDESLTFKSEELEKWWRSLKEEKLRAFAEKRLVASYLDLDGQRRYIRPKSVH